MLVVRRANADEDDERWNDSLGAWLVEARRVAGNSVNHLEVSDAVVPARLRSRKPLWRDIPRDGVLLAGKPLESLAGGRDGR